MLTVYSKSNCQPCRLTKRELDRRGVHYQIIEVKGNDDFMGDTEAMDKILALGYRELPVVVNGDDHWSGFRSDKLKALGGGE